MAKATGMVVSKKQELEKREKEIMVKAEDIRLNGLAIGYLLIEIRDQELWKDSEWLTWDNYLQKRAKALIDKSYTQAKYLFRAAEIHKKLPPTITADVRRNLDHSHMSELGRLAPNVGKEGTRGRKKDYASLKGNDLGRVLNSAAASATNGKLSVRDVRKAVDAELGIDRAAQAKATKKKKEQEERARKRKQEEEALIHNRLEDLAWHLKRHTDGVKVIIREVGDDGWKQWKQDNRVLITRVIAAWGAFAELLA